MTSDTGLPKMLRTTLEHLRVGDLVTFGYNQVYLVLHTELVPKTSYVELFVLVWRVGNNSTQLWKGHRNMGEVCEVLVLTNSEPGQRSEG